MESEILGLRQGFRQADCSSVAPSRLILAGHSVRLRVAGTSLERRLKRALGSSHPRAGSSVEPQLTIELWSADDDGAVLPRRRGQRRQVREWPTGIGTFMVSADGRFAGSEATGECLWLDRSKRLLTGYCAPEAKQSKFFKGRPLFFPLSVWYRDRGIQVIHAALVGRAGEAVLLPGKSGAGKTSTAVACALAGLDFLGDDHVGLSKAQDGQWLGWGLYASSWLEPAQRARFPRLAAASVDGRPPPPDKDLVFVGEVGPGRFRQRAEIVAIALPSVSGKRASSFVPASKMAAYQALALGSMTSVIPRPSATDLELLAAVVEDVPVYRLNLGRDLDDIPRALSRLLDEVTHP